MRWLSTCLLALALALITGPSSVQARPPTQRPSQPAEPKTDNEKVEAAIRAWAEGNWTRVRSLLEPLVQDDRQLDEELLHEAALRYLADATLQDEETLEEAARTELATGYIERLLDSSPDWRPPQDIHNRRFYSLYNLLREQRDGARSRQCMGERAACQADLAETQTRLSRLRSDHTALTKAFAEQEVEVREKVARNRAIALIPFGVGHFYNGRKGLGATFLASEAIFGGIGLGLLIARSFRCQRARGFQRGSVECQVQGVDDGRSLVVRRNVEQAMGLFFVGVVALDIVLAQVTFRPYLTVKTTRVRRQDLGKDDSETRPQRRRAPGRGAPATRDAKPPAPAAPRATPGATPSTGPATVDRDILRVTPAPILVPGGGGLGVALQF